MDRTPYVDENGYNYGYDPNQIYYVDPSLQQAEYYGQGQQYGGWGWQAQGYGQMQPMYGGYPQNGMTYGYYEQYDGGMGYGQQGYVSYDGQAMYSRPNGGNARSKHSYSQNRSRNRQRPEIKQDFSNTEINMNDNVDSNLNNNSSGNKIAAVNHVETDEGTDLIDGKEPQLNNGNDSENVRGGGRFKGTDSRTRRYDQRQQAADRYRGYSKTYRPERQEVNDRNNMVNADGASLEGTEEKKVVMKDDKTDSGGSIKLSRSSRHETGTDRGKDPYFKDRKTGSNFGKAETNKAFKEAQETEAESVMKESEININGLDGKENGGGVRRKRREYQVYSSTNSPRDQQGRPSQYNARDNYERYNYRGQDYNKRHKDFNSGQAERGGDQTKLSENLVGDNKSGEDETSKNKDNDEADDNDYSRVRTVKEGQGKSRVTGPQRGTRLKQKGKVDESQRGVLIEQLSKGSYECMVCCESVRAQHAVWNCNNCYHVFHLRCIKKWARSPNAVVSGAEKDGWRCPACQNLSFKFPNQYRCFCGKVRDPETSRMDTPHSCGDVCQKDRGESCKHPCNILCHPGPCPECNATVTKSCDCGKTKQTAKCSQSTVIKCELVCERTLNCGRHFCKAKCHSGSCDRCEETIVQECYGEHEKREVVCGSEESFTESYSCLTICSKTLDCGNHHCDKPCHLGTCDSCPLLPANTTTCPCGARSLLDLNADPRNSCLDPVPTCGAVCNKVLDCGPPGSPHRCKKLCHEGPCGQCTGSTTLSCRCLFIDKEFKCSDIANNTDNEHKFLCDKRCNRKKLCGRHKCGQPCCVREEHPCDLQCGRKLSCGLHRCTEPCHKNNCPPCLMAGFDELTCHCGAEVLYPPIPCGTDPPECHRPCTRQHGCDHPVRHNCHSEEKCPPCTELTKKMCMGNHVMRSNIPCHLTDISCGMKCSKPLPCGQHCCIKTCHKGACLEEGQACQQLCQRKRELCEHICGAVCHGETLCPKSPCRAKIMVKCICGHREVEDVCSPEPSSEFPRLAMQSLKESIQGFMGESSSVNIGKLTQAKLGKSRILDCNEECAIMERNRRIALALEIENPDLSAKLGNPSYSDFLKEYAKKDSVFVAGIEKALSDLVQSAKQSKQSSRSHAFQSMNMNQRRVVHELAEHYGCQTQSYDYEPKKNVVATAPKDKCWLPSVTLTSLVQRELHPRAPPPIPHLHREDTLRLTNLSSKQSTTFLGEKESAAPSLAGSMPEGWQVIGKKTKKSAATTSVTPKSAIATIDKFESNLADICSTGTIDYDTLSTESKQALKSEPVIDYFDFTVS